MFHAYHYWISLYSWKGLHLQVKAITMKLLAYKDANLFFDLLKIFSICIIGGLEGKQHTSFFGRFTQQNHFRFFSLLLKPITRTFQISQHQDLHASNIGIFLQQIPELKKVIYNELLKKKKNTFWTNQNSFLHSTFYLIYRQSMEGYNYYL